MMLEARRPFRANEGPMTFTPRSQEETTLVLAAQTAVAGQLALRPPFWRTGARRPRVPKAKSRRDDAGRSAMRRHCEPFFTVDSGQALTMAAEGEHAAY